MKTEIPLATHELRFTASQSAGEVSALMLRPPNPKWFLVFGHGAGAGIRHRFMEKLAKELAANAIATLRYQFPYIEKGKKTPDPQPILLKTVRAAATCAQEFAGDLPLFAGGKSLGGRMTSLAAAKEPLPKVKGLVFFGFPLHAPGQPSSERAAHLANVNLPMLFLQGDRDQLAKLELLRPVCEGLGKQATLHVIAGADHGFHVLKSSGRTDDEVIAELAKTTAQWFSFLK
jgi:hypothetical protein